MDASSRPPLPSRNEFDEGRYLMLYPDVAAAIAAGSVDSGWQHFTLHGIAEGRQWVRRADPLIGVIREISPRDEMLRGNAEHYFDVGASALECIETAIRAAGRDAGGIKAALDLPCGHGRVLRFLRKAFPDARLTACDLNKDGVEFCARVFRAVPVLSRVEVDAIPLPERVDLIWCGSLLTHLPASKWAAFFDLFHRQLLPGGVLVFTTHGPQVERELAAGKHAHGLQPRQITALLGEYRRNGFGYVDYDGSAPGYGISLALPVHVREQHVPPDKWRLISYQEAAWDRRQDVVCLQRLGPRIPGPLSAQF